MSQHSTQTLPRWKAILGSLALMAALIAVTPIYSHAIPFDGSYVIDAGQTVTGSFTVFGEQLQTWTFTDQLGFNWNQSIGFIEENGRGDFTQRNLPPPRSHK